jgi:hypothetical protein
MTILYLSVAAAFACVLGMLGFLVYCNGQLDAESNRVRDYRART